MAAELSSVSLTRALLPSGLGSVSSRVKAPVAWRRGVRVAAQAAEGGAKPTATAEQVMSGVVFEPFVEVQTQLVKVPPSTAASEESFARQRYAPACEAGINEQINIEYNISYVYHTLYAYFDRDNVALPGFAEFFKKSSEEEREHAEKFMEYQNKRGGRVKLQSILMPATTEFDNAEKGDALYAMELTLSLEKLVNEKLLHLHQTASDNNDPQMADFIESEFLVEQVDAIKRISEYVAQLRRVGKGHGVYHFDLELQEAVKNGIH